MTIIRKTMAARLRGVAWVALLLTTSACSTGRNGTDVTDSSASASAHGGVIEELVVTGARSGASGRAGPSRATAEPASREASAGFRALAPPPPPPLPPPPPPPPPSAPAPVMAARTADVAPDTGDRPDAAIERRDYAVAPRPADRPQSGQLTAADHDDLLNAGLYEAYARRFVERYGRQQYPLVDTADQVRVLVRGADGRPAALTEVRVRTAAGRALTLTTKADGRIVLFPSFDGLGDRIEVTAMDATGGQVSRAVPVGRPDREVVLTLPSPARKARALDIVLVMDTTGSMGDELSYLTSEMAEILTGVRARNPGVDVRTGLVFYRDRGDEYVARTYPFTADPRAVQDALAAQSANGGGDMPESMQVALAEADAFPWRKDAVKVMLLVADAPPHAGGDFAAAWAAAERARNAGVHIVPVAASGVDDDAQYLMRAMGALTQGRYVFITDDSGIGNSHAEPTVDCYLVTKLDRLISRVVDGLVAGERIEPDRGEVIRRVGNYDQGVCRPRA